jgi:voltage-gated potassium channel
VVLVTPSESLLTDIQERVGEIPAIMGDPSDDDVLLEAGIDRAAGVVLSMLEDKDNVLGVITARRLNRTARIVAATRVQETIPKLQAAGADAVVSPSRIGGLRIASELVRPKVVSFLDQMLRDKGGSLRVEEITIPSTADVAGRTLSSLQINETAGAVLLALKKPGSGEVVFKPDADTALEPGLTIIVMADHEGLARIGVSLERTTGAAPSPAGQSS